MPLNLGQRVAGIFLLCAALGGAVLATVLHFDRRQERLHNAFVDRTVVVGEIFIILDSMERALGEYLRTRDGALLTECAEASGRLRAAAAGARALCADAQGSLDSLRRIDAFNDYQAAILAVDRGGPVANYAPVSFVRMALGRQKIHAQELVNSDLVRNREAYTERLRELRALRLELYAFFLIPAAGVGFLLYRAVRDHIARLEGHARLERQLAAERLENERKERMLVEARASALKARINPHFLFNTLNLIGKSSFLQEPELAMELVEATAKILRYSLDSGSRPTTLRDEIDIVSTYLYLQKARFGAALSYAIDVAEELRGLPSPPMLLQPLAENCFKHGMRGRAGLSVRVAARRAGDVLEISVSDDGIGFPPGGGDAGGIGLENIRARLLLEYGIAEPLRIDSVPGERTTVTLLLPLRADANGGGEAS